MKKESGITLVSLVMYVIVMIIVIGVMNSIISNFYKNTDAVKGNVEEVVRFNNFNTYFLKEVKSKNNGVDSISDNHILFTSGNSFSISSNIIYYNNIEICNNVKSMKIKLGLDGNGIDDSIINVSINFQNFSKSINYKIEEIY